MTTSKTEEVVITLPQGKIKGLHQYSIYEEDYFSFEGIPYGKPPIGELRFKAPQPAESWTDIRDCTEFKVKPVQLNPITGQVDGSEDCLYLNVFTKKLQSEKPLPVMIFIYGGGFVFNSATRETNAPDYFMSEDVVLVTFNYRLCSLGFLSLKDPKLEVPGNAALKDQILALRWVKKYIGHFNGDASNITVFGVSAGGLSTHYLSSTEQTRGLFQKSISMAGSLMNTWATTPQSDFAFRLAKAHGYTGDNVDSKVLEFLRTLEPAKLVQHSLLTPEERAKGLMFTFAPTIEPYVGKDCVIPKPPKELLKTAWGNSIPMIFGGSSSEGLVMYNALKTNPNLMSAMVNQPARLLPAEVRASREPCDIVHLSESLKITHFEHDILEKPFDEALPAFVNYFSYSFLWHSMHRNILSRLKYATAPTYLYRFDFDSADFNHARNRFTGGAIKHGASHAEEISYLLYSKLAWPLKRDTAEFLTIKRMVALFTNFAKNSDPNCEEIKPAIWTAVQKENPFNALNISSTVESIDLPEKHNLEVWNKLYSETELY